MTLLPGAEPFAHDGDTTTPEGRIGVVVSHGFTGCPQSMRPWADALAAAGLTVRLPRLPGHGTTWQELNATQWTDWYGELERSYTELAGRCETVFAMGLSMGGGLVLKLAEDHPELAGVVAVNPSLGSRDKRLLLLPVIKHLVPAFPGVADDIKKEGGHEVAYDRAPLKAVDQLRHLWGVVAPALGTIGCPVLTYRSRVDHVVDSLSGELLTTALGSTGRYTEVILENSYHVATLDNDAGLIERGSLAFVREHAGLGASA